MLSGTESCDVGGDRCDLMTTIVSVYVHTLTHPQHHRSSSHESTSSTSSLSLSHPGERGKCVSGVDGDVADTGGGGQ